MIKNIKIFIAIAVLIFTCACSSLNYKTIKLTGEKFEQIKDIALGLPSNNPHDFLINEIYDSFVVSQDNTEPHGLKIIITCKDINNAENECRFVIDNFRNGKLPERFSMLTVEAGDGTVRKVYSSCQVVEQSGNSMVERNYTPTKVTIRLVEQSGNSTAARTPLFTMETIFCGFRISREELNSGKPATQGKRNWQPSIYYD